METLNIRDTKDWYYAQAFGHTLNHQYIIIFASSKKEAKAKAEPWQQKTGATKTLNLYKNNYKREAEQMVAEGRFII